MALTPNGNFWVVPILRSLSNMFKLFFQIKNVLAAALVAGTVKLTF